VIVQAATPLLLRDYNQAMAPMPRPIMISEASHERRINDLRTGQIRTLHFSANEKRNEEWQSVRQKTDGSWQSQRRWAMPTHQ